MRRAWLAVVVVAVVGAAIYLITLVTGSGPSGPPNVATPPGMAPAVAPVEFPELVGMPRTPDKDDFYTPPNELRGPPGSLVRYREVPIYLNPARTKKVPLISSWQILYRSTSAEGRPNVVSGTLIVPSIPYLGAGPRPIVSYGMGTHGLADRCAPSYRAVRGTELDLVAPGNALPRGWAMVITDYEGLGTPGDHTYAVHRSAGRDVLDAARAASQVPGSGLSDEAPVALWGYSQGGGAVVSAAEQAADYAPELQVVGAAAGGVPADLTTVARAVGNTPVFGLIMAGLVGVDAAYPELDITRSLSPSSRALVERTRNACDIDLLAPEYRNQRLSRLGDLERVLDSPPARDRFARSRLGDVAPKLPMYLYHAQRDEFIPYAVGRKLYDEYCRLGVRVTFRQVGRNHAGAAGDGAKAVTDWLADRIAGKAAPSTCS